MHAAMKQRGHSKMGLASALQLSLDKLPAPNPSRNSWHSGTSKLLTPPPSMWVELQLLQFAANGNAVFVEYQVCGS